MKPSLSRLLCLSVATLLVCWISAVSVHRAESEQATVSGEIEAAELNEDGVATRVAIYDGEWGLVLIAGKGKGKELLKHVGEYAEVQGTLEELGEDSEHDYVMTVSSYVLEDLGESEEDSDEPEEDPDESE